MIRIGKEKITLSRAGIGVQRFMNYTTAGEIGGHEHSHDFVELVFLMRGELRNEIDRCRFIQKPGELALVNYGAVHNLFCRDSDLFNIYLDMSVFSLKQLSPEIIHLLEPVLMPHPGVVNRRNRIGLVYLEETVFMESLLGRMEEYSRLGREYEAPLSHSMNLFLTELALSIKADGKYDKMMSYYDRFGWEEDMERVIGLLERDYRNDLNLTLLSDAAGCSRQHLCRKFKAYTGLTVGDYLLERRLRQAMFLLKTTSDKVTYIAGESGFSHITQFNRKFREYTGMSAGQFRG